MVLTAMTLDAVEIFTHQVLAVWILGWDYGFQYYMILVAAYACLGYFRAAVIPFLMAASALVLFVVSYYYVQHLIVPHVTLSAVVQNTFFVGNVGNVLGFLQKETA